MKEDRLSETKCPTFSEIKSHIHNCDLPGMIRDVDNRWKHLNFPLLYELPTHISSSFSEKIYALEVSLEGQREKTLMWQQECGVAQAVNMALADELAGANAEIDRLRAMIAGKSVAPVAIKDAGNIKWAAWSNQGLPTR